MDQLARLQSVIADVIGGDVRINADTRPSDIDGWDSLNHVLLMFALEHEYGFEFVDGQQLADSTMGELVRLLDS